MGGGASSSYKMTVKTETNAQNTHEWIAQGPTRLIIKADAFENVKPIGKGKFGLVFLAKQSNSIKHVAIKYIPKQIIFDSQAKTRIQKEMDLLVKLSHPFTMRFYGAFDTPSCIGLICEYCVGGELYNRLRKQVKFSEQETKFYFCELASVVRYLHEDMKVVYRDLKPENILIDAQGHIRLCDFGFSTECNGEVDELTDGCGTAMYIAPEIASGFTKFGHGFGVDWWALGCILYEMLTGEAPFGDSDHMTKFEIFNNINEKNVSCPLFMNSNVKTLIKGLLMKKADQRYAWTQVKENPWLSDVAWDNVDSKAIVPPWIPKASNVGSVENFVSWEIMLPQSAPSGAVVGYCAQLQLPKKAIEAGGSDSPDKLLQKRISNANLVKAPSSAVLNKQQSSALLAKQVSVKGSLVPQPSTKKLDSSKSKAVVPVNETTMEESSTPALGNSPVGVRRKVLPNASSTTNSPVVSKRT